MSRYLQLFFLGLVLLLCACAQVGTLTGGSKDEFAPAPKKISPPSKTTQFSGNSIQFEFDEYIKLENPQQNVYFIPGDVKPTVELYKKTVTVSWNESLQPNTTYTLYMNGAVKDTHEGNDSLMTYVFSTGEIIDSISYSVTTADAWSGKPLSKILVALYEDSISTKAKYFAQTDFSGRTTIQNMKPGTYFLRAFADLDKNLAISENEIRGFNAEKIDLYDSAVDSFPVRMFKPQNQKISTFKLQAPGMISIAKIGLSDVQLSMGNKVLEDEQIYRLNEDSVLLFLPSDSISLLEVVASKDDRSDTLRMTVSKRDHQTKLNLKPTIKRAIRPSEKIEFEVNDRILSLNIAKIVVVDANTKDTLEVKEASFFANRIVLELDRKSHSKIDVIFQDGAFSSTHVKSSMASTLSIDLKSDRDLGSIKVNTWESNEPLLLFVYQQGTLDRVVTIPEEHTIIIPELEPGNYTFKVVEDVNRNGKWDVGDDAHFVQPEIIHEFVGPTVRANWETEIQLSID
ncbi:MAG: Ig-like domain-containing domain [Bacteroidota bacterium]